MRLEDPGSAQADPGRKRGKRQITCETSPYRGFIKYRGLPCRVRALVTQDLVNGRSPWALRVNEHNSLRGFGGSRKGLRFDQARAKSVNSSFFQTIQCSVSSSPLLLT